MQQLDARDAARRAGPFATADSCYGAQFTKISYDLLYDYGKFIVRSTYDSDLQRAKTSFRNIVS